MEMKLQSKSINKNSKTIKTENYFVLGNGGVLKDIKELAECIDHLSDDEFRHHVNEQKNDFANWVRDVFDEKILADELFSIKDRKDTQIKLLKFLVNKR